MKKFFRWALEKPYKFDRILVLAVSIFVSIIAIVELIKAI